MSQFDDVAKTWDEKPERIRLAQSIGQFITQKIPAGSFWNILDYGCGTGNISLQLAPLVNTVTGMDSSQGMLEVFQKKAIQMKYGHIKTMFYNLEDQPIPALRFDMIITTMALHHVNRLATVLDAFVSMLNPEGRLLIADLMPEDGSFHGSTREAQHHGLNPDELKHHLSSIGFNSVFHEIVAQMKRSQPDGTVREYPIFLLEAIRQNPA